MNTRTHCDELLEVVDAMEEGIRAPLEGISQEHLNHVFGPHKMSIGQLAVHCVAYPQWFMSTTPPWEKTEWTCRPCVYPLTMDFVDQAIREGMGAMRDKLRSIDDSQLELDANGAKGLGYRLCRLQLHILWHSGQMSYLRDLLDPKWFQKGKGFFGRMVTAYIRMPYHTEQPR